MRILLLIALLFLPLGSAQLPADVFSVNGSGPVELSPTTESVFEVSVTFGCQEILLENGAAVVVEFATTYEGISSSQETIDFAITDCIGAESVTKSASIKVTASNATGLISFIPSILATHGTEIASMELPETFVGYRAGHTMTPNGDQTFQVDSATFEFDLVLEIQANSKTMVMFENKAVSGAAGLTGLKANIFDVAAGETQLTNKITFSAPESNWEQETVTFYTYSHCLGGDNCDPNLEQNVTWTFVNAGEPIPEVAEEKSTPGPSFALAVGLIALGVTWRRK